MSELKLRRDALTKDKPKSTEIPHSADSVRNDTAIFPVAVMMFEMRLQFR
jgi:hypothetical protein